MPFLLLLFLTLVCIPNNWPAPPWTALESTAISAGLTWLGVAVVVGFARTIAAGVTHRLVLDPGRRERVLRRYGRQRTYHLILLIGVYAATLFFLGWGWTVQQFCSEGNQMLPGAEVVILAPFLAGLVLSWVVFYDAERALHDSAEMSEADIERAKGLAAVGFNDQAQTELPSSSEPFWSRSAYVAFHVRQNLALVLAPLLLLLLMKGLHRLVPETEEGPWDKVVTLACVVLSLSVFVGMPWLLRLALGLRPLPAGPLRDRLEATAGRLHFRCSDILVWNTRGGVANAMVAGVVPWVRYVLLTDRLMSELSPDEVEAVFGHEVGHVKHHHMLYYIGFLLVSLFLVYGLYVWLAHLLHLADSSRGPDETIWQALPLVTMLGAYIFVVFGFLSRRCERQADVYGCRAVSCTRPDCCGHTEGTELALRGRGLCSTGIRTFIEALEKVARLNGISRDKPGWLSSWQHSTIARRVEFLQSVLADRALERSFQRRVALVKWGLLVVLFAALAALFWSPPPDKTPPAENATPAATGELDSVTPGTAAHTVPSE
jgi:Zn-dependent protease with chaperone function